ncbi:MAG: hypothetical protein WCL38_05605 [Actinomycetota bacterium]
MFMSTTFRKTALTLSSAALTAVLLASPASASTNVAPRVATWLTQQTTQGAFLSGSKVSVSETAGFALAVSAFSNAKPNGRSAMRVLWQQAATLRTSLGAQDPGGLALWILAAHAYGVNPRHFNKVDLVAALQSTLQGPSSSAPGRFGSEDSTYDGSFRQGLSMAALKAAGVAVPKSAVAWLKKQGCSNGAYSSDATANPCSGSPADYAGPDLNSTALAVLGLKAAGSAIGATTLSYLKNQQQVDGGWGFYPGNASDPSSTGLVLTALQSLAMVPPKSAGNFAKGISSIAHFQVSSGGLAYPGNPSADVLSSTQGLQGLTGHPIWSTNDAAGARQISR